jgi:hypothetical protein
LAPIKGRRQCWSLNLSSSSANVGLHPLAILGEHDFTFADLNGTQLTGQHVSLDFIFSGHEFARITSRTDPFFYIVARFNTNGQPDANDSPVPVDHRLSVRAASPTIGVYFGELRIAIENITITMAPITITSAIRN